MFHLILNIIERNQDKFTENDNEVSYIMRIIISNFIDYCRCIYSWKNIYKYNKKTIGPNTNNCEDKKSITLVKLIIIFERLAFDIVWLTVTKSLV